jgi:acyl-ACP thioesterase
VVEMIEMVPEPTVGRVFAASRRVRLGDSSPGGRLRLDAIARYLQDVSDDDTRDAGLPESSWVVRRTAIRVDTFPRYLEPLALRTWCAGLGPRWAERRVSIVGAEGGRVEAATLWVHVAPATLRPLGLPAAFSELFAASALGRRLSARLTIGQRDDRAATVPWALRFTDFDVLGHVNNAVAWSMLEELLAGRRVLRAPLHTLVEFAAPVDPGSVAQLSVLHSEDGFLGWLSDADGTQRIALSAHRARPESTGTVGSTTAVTPLSNRP